MSGINWDAIPARRYVVVGFDPESKQLRYLSSEPGPAGFSHKRRRTWSPHLTEASLYTTLVGAKESLWKIITHKLQSLPAPISDMHIRVVSMTVMEEVKLGVTSL